MSVLIICQLRIFEYNAVGSTGQPYCFNSCVALPYHVVLVVVCVLACDAPCCSLHSFGLRFLRHLGYPFGILSNDLGLSWDSHGSLLWLDSFLARLKIGVSLSLVPAACFGLWRS